jgi:hypothetical protein
VLMRTFRFLPENLLTAAFQLSYSERQGLSALFFRAVAAMPCSSR